MTMKILKVKSRDYGKKTYYKFRINIPKETLEIAELKEGDSLMIQAKRGEVRLIKKIKKEK